LTNYYSDIFAIKEIPKYKLTDELSIDNMIHTISKTHGISWSDAEEYTKLKFYKIILFENILYENSKPSE